MRRERVSRTPGTVVSTGRRVRILSLFCAYALALAVTSAAAAADPEWPDLTPGLWRFTRVMEIGGKPTTIERTVCVDPVAEWKKQHETSIRSGCKVTTSKIAPDRFLTTADCDIPGVGKGVSRSTAVIEDSGHYQVTVENEGVVAQTGAREQLVAKRLGECPE